MPSVLVTGIDYMMAGYSHMYGNMNIVVRWGKYRQHGVGGIYLWAFMELRPGGKWTWDG